MSYQSVCCLYICIHACIHLSIHLSTYTSVCLICLSFRLSIYPSVFLSIRPSARPSVFPPVHPSVCMPACMYVFLYIYRSIHPFSHPSVDQLKIWNSLSSCDRNSYCFINNPPIFSTCDISVLRKTANIRPAMYDGSDARQIYTCIQALCCIYVCVCVSSICRYEF
jgi:hypothetical protein